MSRRWPGVAALLFLLAALQACEPPLTEARRSLAIRDVFLDLTGAPADSDRRRDGAAACLLTRYLAPGDSALPSLLRTALRQRGVPLTEGAGAPEAGAAVVAVSPVRELDGALGLDAAVGRTVGDDRELRTEWKEWTYRLRCGPAECEIVDRMGPRPSREEANTGTWAAACRGNDGP